MISTLRYCVATQHFEPKTPEVAALGSAAKAIVMAVTLLMLSAAVAQPMLARQTPVNLTSRQRPVQISMMALYQNYEEDGPGVDQLSFPLTIVAPL